ncbi:MAG: N-6 DNA methylase [Gallionellaceae bacterium]|jgi:predicted type IV restriction endonuclease
MPVPLEVIKLIENFEGNLDAYRGGKYNETQVRRDFIDPLFKALGWDMDNSVGYAEAYRDVIHEDAIKIGTSTKAPDYSFRVGGQRKFFLEAKKPSVNVKDDIEPAFQLRRYAWSAKLPLSIVTDFEEFAIYDCRQKPDKGDKASKSRLFYCTYRDYVEKWDEIAGIFSKEAVLKGSFDKYAVSTKGKRGTTEVDSAFLEEIEGWRDVLARNIALRNANLSQRELNFAVQQTIDRIIFLRICEDRGIEPYGKLMALQNGVRVYDRLREMFRDADDRYNSGLFHFKREKGRPESPDELTLSLEIDDKPLKEIFKNLYYPDCPYEFSVLGAEILGSVYEQFLGKVIRLTAGNRAVVEDKPEVKKAGGVFYTPAYIVKYIVEHTVGKLLEGKSSKQAAGITILDPACGSGSFLIGAYQYLLDWYLVRYVEEGSEKHSKGKEARLRASASGEWRLTTSEKKRILLAHIYGVDIDAQAVEVTKLSLLLKVLEGESDQTLTSQMKLFHERVLPDLEHNIQCGNSLIGPDFYDGQLELDGETVQRINVFDWQAAFPQVFKAGGFDSVIGNPPYIFTRELFTSEERAYYASKYKLGWEKQNTYLVFMERMLSLVSKNGNGGYIVPNSWLTIESAKLLRAEFVKHLRLVLDLNYAVFRGVSMEPCVFIIDGKINSKTVTCARCTSAEQIVDVSYIEVAPETWAQSGSRITFSAHGALQKILIGIKEKHPSLGDTFEVRTGLQAYETGKGSPPQTKSDVSNHVFDCTTKEDKTCVRYFEGRDIGRFFQNWSGLWMKYGPWLSQPREPSMFSRPRILIREITSQPPYCINATLVNDTFLNNKSILNVLEPSDNVDRLKVLCAVLNSRLMSECYRAFAVKAVRKLFPKIVINNLREFPIPAKLGESLQNRALDFRKIIALVDLMMDIHQRLATAKTPQDTTLLQRQITATDNQIDQLVYQLYGLTEDEIALVEGAT